MLLNKLLWKSSRKVTQITRYRMKEEQFASENYQIMNYGIGGRISMHLDSVGKIFLKPCFSIGPKQFWTCKNSFGPVQMALYKSTLFGPVFFFEKWV